MIKSKQLSLFSLVIVGLLQGLVFAQGFPAPSVNVVNAEIKALAPVAWVSGSVVSRNNSQIAAEVSGRLIGLAEIGAQVKKGEIIARIDPQTLLLQKNDDVASVQNAKARLVFLESEVTRKTSLAKRNLSAITDLDQTVSQRDVALGDLASAESRLAQTQQKLDFTNLKAPFDGTVVSRLVSQGEVINAGSAIIRLVETQNLEASLYAPLTAYRFLINAKQLAVESPLGKGMANIKSVIPVADSRSHLMEVRLDLSTFDWPVGLNIKAAVASGESKEVLAVPRDALVLRREGISIFRISAENTAEQISVEVGIGAGQMVEVIGDVHAGDKIVIRGAERLQPGQAVQIKTNNQSLISGDQ